MRSAAPPLCGRRASIQGMPMSDAGLSPAVRGGSDAAPVAAVRNITKRFPGVLANDKVSLDFRAGEIHVLLGENGAGKSTLIAILAGMQQPDEGEILLGGNRSRSVRRARVSTAALEPCSSMCCWFPVFPS